MKFGFTQITIFLSTSWYHGTNSHCSRVRYYIPWRGLSPVLVSLLITLSHVLNSQRAGARDDRGNPIIRDFYSSPLTARYPILNLYACILVARFLVGDYVIAALYIIFLIIVSAVMPMTKCYLLNLRVYTLVLVALALRWLVFVVNVRLRHCVLHPYVAVIALIFTVGTKYGARASCMDRMVSF